MFIVKKSIFLVLVLALALININSFSGLPEVNKPPFYDMEFGHNSNWWDECTDTEETLIDNYESYFEIAICVYNNNSAPAEIGIGFYMGNLGKKVFPNDAKLVMPSRGFYVYYASFYKTDTEHYYVALYTDDGQKIDEKNPNMIDYTGTSCKIAIASNTSIYTSDKYWLKSLSSGESHSFGPLWGALNWLLYDQNNPQIKVVLIKSYTSPATVKIYSSDMNKFYEQGFSANEQTYVFCNATKITVFAYGPAGSKEINITQNGLWIVVINSSLTDIYLNQTQEQGEENQTTPSMFWLNTTVIPEDYHIEYYINNTVNATGVGHLEKQYNNTYVKVIIKTSSGFQKYAGTYFMDKNYNLFFYFQDIRTSEKFNLTVKCYTYTPWEPTIANVSLYNSLGNLVQKQNNVQFAKFTNLQRDVYTVIAEKSGYRTIQFTVDLNESLVYTVVFIDVDTGELIPWDVESGSQSDVETYHDTMSSVEYSPPSVPTDSTWYGIHFVIVDSSTKQLYQGDVNVWIYCVKGISRANFWHDNVEIPIDSLTISNGSEYWWMSEEDLNNLIGKQLWEYISAFRIYFGNKVMTIPASRCRNMFYNLTIYTDGNEAAMFGYNNPGTYTSGYLGPNPLSSQLVSLLIPLMVFMLVMKMIDAISRRR